MTFSPSTSTKSLRVGIVASRFNQGVTDALLATAERECARQHIAKENVVILRVPGAVEIPSALQLLAEEQRYDFLVALGAVIRGETAHFDYVSRIAADGILAVMLRYRIPIGFGVLTLLKKSQAAKRIEIARQAVRAGLELALLKKSRVGAPMLSELSGTITNGKRRASRLGFPTINIDYEEGSLLPEEGVYAGMLRYHGNDYPGAVAFGRAGKSARPKLEIYCFKTVPLAETQRKAVCAFLKRVSDFVPATAPALKKKISRDVRRVKKIFSGPVAL